MESSSENSYEDIQRSSEVNVPHHPPVMRNRSLRDNIEDGFVVLDTPENDIEVKKMEQNYMFGFKKWKAHVTVRPFEERSEAVKSLYTSRFDRIRSTYVPGNITYTLWIGIPVALLYLLIGAIMAVTIIGWPYARFCWKLAGYFIWPFGKFVNEETSYEPEQASVHGEEGGNASVIEDTHAVSDNEGASRLMNDGLAAGPSSGSSDSQPIYLRKVSRTTIWRRPATYVWLLIGCPILSLAHLLVILVTGLLVVLIPVSKLYLASMKKLFLMPPEKLSISCSPPSHREQRLPQEVIMCIYQAVNLYFYKFTVDGMNIIITNMLIFVLITLSLGYVKFSEEIPVVKFIFGAISIIPLAHYIGFAITSISSQSRHVVGAFLNALFGSFIEIFIYISTLLKGKDNNSSKPCYPAIVKSALTGSLLATMLFIPGLCMVVGGLKHKEQAVNVRSASVSSTLLFISVAGAFSPTMFALTYGGFQCAQCQVGMNGSFYSYECENCRYTTVGMPGDSNFYEERVLPIVISIAVLLPMAYVIGLAYSLVTHAHVLENHFKEKEAQENRRMGNSGQHSSQASGQHSGHHATPVVLWGRTKSLVILIVSTTAMAFCAEVAVESLEHILSAEGSRITETFIGVTVIAVIPEIPEIINGIQFALKNNINLSLEIGSSIAVQVCLLQIPILVVADLILGLNFRLLFNNLDFWSVILSVIIVNYTFVDGKSDYFQGSMLCIVYFILLIMYFFAPEQVCRD